MNINKQFEHEIDPDLLAEIEEWEKADHDEPVEYYFSNPDPYLKPQPLPPDHPRHNYTVTGSYDGVETLDKKMESVMGEKFTEKMEDSE